MKLIQWFDFINSSVYYINIYFQISIDRMFHFTDFLVNKKKGKNEFYLYLFETVDKLVRILHQKNTGVKILFLFSLILEFNL